MQQGHQTTHTAFGKAVYSILVTPGREVGKAAPLISEPLSAVSIIFQLLLLTLPVSGTPPAGSVTCIAQGCMCSLCHMELT